MEIPNTLPCRQQLAAIEQAAHFTQCTRNLPTASLVPYRIWRTPTISTSWKDPSPHAAQPAPYRA